MSDSSDDEGTSSVTRAYTESEDDRVSIPDQTEVNTNVTELIHDDRNDFLNDFVKFLSSQQSQQTSIKDDFSKPLKNKMVVVHESLGNIHESLGRKNLNLSSKLTLILKPAEKA